MINIVAREAVDKKLDGVDLLKRGEKWETQKSFYQGLLVDLRNFKDAVRDPVAHARVTRLHLVTLGRNCPEQPYGFNNEDAKALRPDPEA
jgi:hypothetical protein